MKRGILVLLALVVFSSTILVKNASALLKWDFGVKAGVSSASLHGNVTQFITLPQLTILSDLKDPRTGFTGGLFATVHVSPMFAVQVEALYAQKGASGRTAIIRSGTTILDTDVTIELDYIDFPVLFMLNFPAGALEFTGYGGFSVGFNRKSGARIVVGGTEQVINIESIVKGIDADGILGLALSFGVASVDVILDGRFAYSIESIDNSPSAGNIKNGALIFMVGVTIPTGL
jgi:hypothetical protein